MEELFAIGRDQPGVRAGSTHIVVVLLRQFAMDCFALAPGSLSIWRSHNNVILTEGKMPLNHYRDDGEVAAAEGVRPRGQGIPVAYVCRIYVLATGNNFIVLNRGVPEAERKACFGGQSSLELTEEGAGSWPKVSASEI